MLGTGLVRMEEESFWSQKVVFSLWYNSIVYSAVKSNRVHLLDSFAAYVFFCFSDPMEQTEITANPIGEQ